jgi:hypothetical protein
MKTAMSAPLAWINGKVTILPAALWGPGFIQS